MPTCVRCGAPVPTGGNYCIMQHTQPPISLTAATPLQPPSDQNPTVLPPVGSLPTEIAIERTWLDGGRCEGCDIELTPAHEKCPECERPRVPIPPVDPYSAILKPGASGLQTSSGKSKPPVTERSGVHAKTKYSYVAHASDPPEDDPQLPPPKRDRSNR